MRHIRVATKRRHLLGALLIAYLQPSSSIRALAKTNEQEMRISAERKQRMQRAHEEEARQVEQRYSTKPIRVRLRTSEYVIPANYLGPKGKDEPDVIDANDGFDFVLFLPDYTGFTKENWQKGKFDRRRIDVLQLKTVDRNARIPLSGGGDQLITPANYGEPSARFKNLRRGLIREPRLDAHGLEAYLRKNDRLGQAVWTGVRSNGEFLYFRSTSIPGAQIAADRYPLCDVRYYSEKEDLYIAYAYSVDHISKWQEIDDAIWRRLHAWRAK